MTSLYVKKIQMEDQYLQKCVDATAKDERATKYSVYRRENGSSASAFVGKMVQIAHDNLRNNKND